MAIQTVTAGYLLGGCVSEERRRRRDPKVASRLKVAREAKELTQEQVAERLGYSDNAAISLIESARRGVPTERLQQFAELYGVTVGWLLTGQADSENDRDVELSWALEYLRSRTGRERERAIRLLKENQVYHSDDPTGP
jgi:transcriptional regulator with XRE-family HTH domain